MKLQAILPKDQRQDSQYFIFFYSLYQHLGTSHQSLRHQHSWNALFQLLKSF